MVQIIQNPLLTFFQIPLGQHNSSDDILILFFSFRHFLLHHLREQLLLQPLQGDAEINNHSSNKGLGHQAGVGVVVHHVEHKFITVIHFLISNFNHLLLVFQVNLLQKQRFQEIVNLVWEILRQNDLPKPHTVFQLLYERVVIALEHDYPVLLQVLYPLRPLILRIDQIRILTRLLHNQGVFNGNLIRRQSLGSPVLNFQFIPYYFF